MINIVRAFRTGVRDGFDQPNQLSSGMTYREPMRQWAWDQGSLIGQRVGRLRNAWPHEEGCRHTLPPFHQ